MDTLQLCNNSYTIFGRFPNKFGYKNIYSFFGIVVRLKSHSRNETLYNALHLYRPFANIRGKSVPERRTAPEKTYINRFIIILDISILTKSLIKECQDIKTLYYIPNILHTQLFIILLYKCPS